MKQKILIGASSNSDKLALHERLQGFLNKQHEYFLTFLLLDQFQEPVLAQSRSNSQEFSTADITKKIEFEMEVEMLPSHSEMRVDVFKQELSLTNLHGLTKVADLLVIDAEAFKHDDNWNRINEITDKVNCPVLVLPRGRNVSRIIMVHDPREQSINMVKSFLKLFNQDLTQFPLSVLFAFPDDEEQTENEKFFVEYLKMSFPNLGLQLMIEAPIDELIANLDSDDQNALVLVSQKLGAEILEYPKDRKYKACNTPLFIYKS